jgi:L-seryl-tRNA(Ser) seleniumtransferase
MANLRDLPRVDAVANAPGLCSFSPRIRLLAARLALDELRSAALNGKNDISFDSAADLALKAAVRLTSPSLRPVINASGVVLHTGAGRARLADTAVQQLLMVAGGHAAVEFDLESGRRGDRQAHVRDLLCDLTGAEDAMVVNNCAAAVLLSLQALAGGRDVILSRGQMVEIGGSFRMPEIVAHSGCRLVEVGCTNKTRLSDYRQAIGEETAAILRCHPSNYRIVGFTAEPSLTELCALAKESGVLLIDDLGSGCLLDVSTYGLPKEPTVQESLSAGADVVLSSGDKLLGGPQAGLILGRKEVIAELRRHPVARAVRIDKLTLAALEATLRLYREERADEIPTWRYIGRSLEQVKSDAERLAKATSKATVELSETEVGGGSLPARGIPTYCAVIATERPDELAQSLRTGDPAVIVRVQDGRVWLDPRTMEPDEVDAVAVLLGAL